MLSQLYSFLWDERFWLPQPYKWKDIQPPTAIDLSFSLILGFFFWASKILLQRQVLHTLGRQTLANGVEQVLRSDSLFNKKFTEDYHVSQESEHKPYIGRSGQILEKVSTEDNLTECYLHLTKAKSSIQSLKSLSYRSWRLFYFALSWIFGISLLSKESWFWNIEECWTRFHDQNVHSGLYWYYSTAIGFYWSLIFIHVSDSRHRLPCSSSVKYGLNILILYVLWIAGLIKFGAFMVVVHESAKIPLEVAQICKLLGRSKLYLGMYLAYIITWLCSRLILLPSLVLKVTLIDAKVHLGIYPMYYLLNILVSILIVLHITRAFSIISVDTEEVQSGRPGKGVTTLSSKND